MSQWKRMAAMAPTSEERREVAERLREHDGNAYADVADMCDEDLADLIDPTCHDASPQAYGAFECSECGAQTWYQSIETRPKYCPCCGARVVSD